MISKFISYDRDSKLIKPIALFFLTHNILFAFGLSLKGDYIDYFIFSLEYLAFCLGIVFLFKMANVYAKILRVFGTIAISLGFIVGLIGIFMFIIISRDYETDKIFHFEKNSKTYETRRYSFGFATSANVRYTFKTYRTFKYLPIENQIDVTDFFDNKTDLDIDKDDLKISVVNINNKEQIVFKSANGHIFYKSIN